MRLTAPFNLLEWIDRHRGDLKPPVGNKVLFEDSGFIVMAVGGPNSRKDFHHDPSEEIFYQVEGDIILKTVQDGRQVDMPIRAGERCSCCLPRCRTRPAAPPAAVGVVVERRRGPEELDGFSWYCEHCGHTACIFERVPVSNIETRAAEDFRAFLFDNTAQRTCGVCGTVMQAPS